MFLSIIVPVFNVGPYLRECLDSLLEQDFSKSDYEIICIDDGSTDNGPEILQAYVERNDRIVVVRQDNAGVSAARNRGIDLAQGDYLWFVDADDLITGDALRLLKEKADSGSFDRIAFAYYAFDQQLTQTERVSFLNGSLAANSASKDYSVCTSILSRRLIVEQKLRFRGVSHGEDSLFAFEFMNRADSQAVIEKPLYLYRKRPMSATSADSKENHARKYLSFRKNAEIMKAYYEGSNGPVKDRTHCANQFMAFLQYALWEVSMMPGPQAKQARKELHQSGLYPYKRPKESNLQRNYQTPDSNLRTKFSGFLYLHQTSRFWFRVLCLIQRLRSCLSQGRS